MSCLVNFPSDLQHQCQCDNCRMDVLNRVAVKENSHSWKINRSFSTLESVSFMQEDVGFKKRALTLLLLVEACFTNRHQFLHGALHVV